MTIARINESALLNAGIDRQTVLALRHFLRQVGDRLGEATLPDVAAATDALNPVISGLQLADAAIRAATAILEVEQTNLPAPDRALCRLIEDLQAALQEQSISRDALARQVDALGAELQEARTTNNALSRRLDDLENRVN